jgi:hypothetical protein
MLGFLNRNLRITSQETKSAAYFNFFFECVGIVLVLDGVR